MNKIINYLLFVIAAGAMTGCKKEKIETNALSGDMYVINGAIDVGPVKVNPSGKGINYAATTEQVNFGAGRFYYASVGTTTVTVVPTADTTRYLFNRSVSINPKVYTLFICGTNAAPDTMFREEELPFIRKDVTAPSADSVVNVRFVNLSPNSVPVKIKISNAIANEVDNLPYKSISPWKAYPAKLTTTAYAFQVRDAITDALLFTFNFNATATNRFNNVTLFIKGLQGTTSGTNAFGIAVANYF